jgi:hypothetical protein
MNQSTDLKEGTSVFPMQPKHAWDKLIKLTGNVEDYVMCNFY